jgi:hypothetical protein
MGEHLSVLNVWGTLLHPAKPSSAITPLFESPSYLAPELITSRKDVVPRSSFPPQVLSMWQVLSMLWSVAICSGQLVRES